MRHALPLAGGFPEPHECDRRSSFPSPDRASEGVASPEIETALADLERALCRDRSHAVVVVPPGPQGALLLRALMKRLPASLRGVQLAAPTLHGAEVCARILRELRQGAAPDAEASLLGLVQELARRGSALALLISDAGTLQAHALGCLGRLATASRSGLRLVLVVASEPRSDGNAIAELVAALGVGAQKIVLSTRADRAQSEARTPLEPSGPEHGVAPFATACASRPGGPAPRAERAGQRSRSLAGAIRAGKPRRYFSRRRRWPLGATVALGMALALLGVQPLWAPTLPRGGVAEAEHLAEHGEPARSRVSATSQPAPSRPQAEAAAADDGARSAVSARPPARSRPAGKARAAFAPPARTIPVNLNARPWARIEVDGREVGVTPLANLPVAPGLHRFRAHLADGRVVERTIRVDAYRNYVSFP